MSLRHLFTTTFIKIFGKPRIKRLIAKQRSLKKHPEALTPTTNSPKRFEIPLEMLNLIQDNDIKIQHIFPIRHLLSIIKNIHKSVDSLQNNPKHPKPETTKEFLEKLKKHIKSQGIGHFAFVKLPHEFIFQEYGVLYDNAIVLTMEMNKELIDKAPSQATLDMVFSTYDELGKAVNNITEYLREHGFASQADHPLGGLVLFPPLAQKAGIGWVGKHGLLISPKFGPRQRLAAVYTNISNFQFTESNTHAWIEDYCKMCRVCVDNCPPKAILDEPLIDVDGRVTHIVQQDCFEYFAQNFGCSICIKVCPFSVKPYDELKTIVTKLKL